MNRPGLPRLFNRLRHGGIRWLAAALRERVAPSHPSFHFSAKSALRNGAALEIGGPSRLFRPRGGLPAYAWLSRVDNVNFAAATAWENDLRDGGEFHFHPAKPPGRQFLREASVLSDLPDGAYDVVLSSHCLEHLADPLRALSEWRRVVRPGGHLLVAVPDPSRTFDHRRPLTTLPHLVSDFQRQTTEDDLSHLDEVLALHDLARDPAAGSRIEFEARCRDNLRHRCLHHHVFDLALLRDSLAESGWETVAVEKLAPLHLVAWARRPASP
jgi:SAM-dependent methyltransferase